MQIRNIRLQAKRIRQRKNIRICWDEKKKSNASKTKNATRGNKVEGTGERRKTKKTSRQDKTIQTKQDIPKQREKILPASRGECMNTYQQPDDKETKQFLTKIWRRRKAEGISNMRKELEGIEESPKAKMHLDSRTQKITKLENAWSWWQIWILVWKFTSIHGRLAIEMNRCLQETDIPEWMIKGKTTLIQKRPLKRSRPQTTTDP